MQRRGQEEAYGWDHGGRKIPAPPIPTGTHPVKVELEVAGCRCGTFYFELVINGIGDYLELRESAGAQNPVSRRWERERNNNPTIAETKQLPVSLRVDVGRRDLGSAGEFLMWADLHIRNDSEYPVSDVGVNVELVRNAFTINGQYVWSPAVDGIRLALSGL